jgi:hypothetical protein
MVRKLYARNLKATMKKAAHRAAFLLARIQKNKYFLLFSKKAKFDKSYLLIDPPKQSISGTEGF